MSRYNICLRSAHVLRHGSKHPREIADLNFIRVHHQHIADAKADDLLGNRGACSPDADNADL
jgi:hypothetical protein